MDLFIDSLHLSVRSNDQVLFLTVSKNSSGTLHSACSCTQWNLLSFAGFACVCSAVDRVVLSRCTVGDTTSKYQVPYQVDNHRNERQGGFEKAFKRLIELVLTMTASA
jgi:hypothetical protein